MNKVNCNGMGEMPGQEGYDPSNEAYNDWYEKHSYEMKEYYAKTHPDEDIDNIEDSEGYKVYVETQSEIYKRTMGEY